ncbi:hypothetical protein AAG570_008761 [Ranatra chinensis]|uniref:Uncharacterized protein n=1 Tax=Ranatra chinensis TaxID=642074 RepID=A0ABD0YRU6_9HEMI
MASKRRNMFYENKKHETTEIGLASVNERISLCLQSGTPGLFIHAGDDFAGVAGKKAVQVEEEKEEAAGGGCPIWKDDPPPPTASRAAGRAVFRQSCLFAWDPSARRRSGASGGVQGRG